MENLLEQANADAIEWGKLTRKKLAAAVASLTLRDRRALQKSAWHKTHDEEYKALQKSIGVNFKREFGQIYRINFLFQRHGIFLEHGVGRGRLVRSAKAKPKPFLAPILNPAVEELADIISSRYADIISGEIKLSIPGIINRRVRVGATEKDNG